MGCRCERPGTTLVSADGIADWLAYLLTEAPDGPVVMVAPTMHTVDPDIVWPLRELLQDAFQFNPRALTGSIGPRRVFILLASDPRCGQRLRGMWLAGAWGVDCLRGDAAATLEHRLQPGAKWFP